jgi:hypothetical protein
MDGGPFDIDVDHVSILKKSELKQEGNSFMPSVILE